MKKVIILLIFAQSLCLNFAFSLNEIVLPKQYKVLKTFSANIGENTSLHIVYTKNRKSKKLEQIVYINENIKGAKEVAKVFDLKGNIEFYHFKNNIFTAFSSSETNGISYLQKYDINLSTGKLSTEKKFLKPSNHTNINLKDKTYSILNYPNMLVVKEYKGNLVMKPRKIMLSNSTELDKYFHYKDIPYIRTDEFVKSSSVAKTKAFYNNDTVYYVKDNIKNYSTKIVSLPLRDKNNLSVKEFPLTNYTKHKRLASYLYKDYLIQVVADKNQGLIQFSNIKTSKVLFSRILNNDFLKEIGIDYNSFNLKGFLRNACAKQANLLTIINETKSGTFLVEIDYRAPGYYYDPSFRFFNHQMLFQNNASQQILNHGPSYSDERNLFEQNTNSNRIIEFIIDSKGNISKAKNYRTKYKKVSYDKLVERYNFDTNIKYVSYCVTKKYFRHLKYDKKNRKLTFSSQYI